MDSAKILERLAPFLEGESISPEQLEQTSAHLALLLKWNPRVNLTSIREEDEIVTRHFGESLFAARRLRPLISPTATLFDLGSGAGFPGIPIKVWIPGLHVTLIESRQKKATFLNEVIRTLGMLGTAVENRRAEQLEARADVVTLRAVERFEEALGVAASLIRPEGRLALFVGTQQTAVANSLLPQFMWNNPQPIPMSASKVLLVGQAPG
jgi:16S rRNA (guanine527-N7)-methyltransferase